MSKLITLATLDKYVVIPTTLRYDVMIGDTPEELGDTFNGYMRCYHSQFHHYLNHMTAPVLSIHRPVHVRSHRPVHVRSWEQNSIALYLTYYNGNGFVTVKQNPEDITVGMLMALAKFPDRTILRAIISGMGECIRLMLSRERTLPIEVLRENHHVGPEGDSGCDIGVVRSAVELRRGAAIPALDVEVYQQLQRYMDCDLVDLLFPPAAFMAIKKAPEEQSSQQSVVVSQGSGDLTKMAEELSEICQRNPEMIKLEGSTMPVEIWEKVAPVIIKAKLDYGAPLTKQETEFLTDVLKGRILSDMTDNYLNNKGKE